ncbi:PhzF family phenazine biosynthesis protein [Terrabacter sp. 2RAF25]|uniref:PhzF family phenazine biosynthesis protein n=1 Tax=Terrabacter sp. 2RAF25 TaxID=3232998 RepID=UPI003F9DD959
MELPFRIVNVFGIEGDPFSGNALAVFEEASGLDDSEMQAWARQFNLSEVTFVDDGASTDTARADGPARASVRIFTATYEMPFAGHPTLGTAHVVADRAAAHVGGPVDQVLLTMPAGDIPVRRTSDGWQLQANPPQHRQARATPRQVAAALGVPVTALVTGATQWVSCGVESLVVQVDDLEALRSAAPNPTLMLEHLAMPERPPHAYLWAWTGPDTIEARMFAAAGTTLEEDPATGSACSSLGGWFVGQGRTALEVVVSQGAQTGRPSRLVLTVDSDATIRVAGRVAEVGSGTVSRG